MAVSDNTSTTKPTMPTGNLGRTPILPTQGAAARPGEVQRPGVGPSGGLSGEPAPRRSETQHRTLIVGREIALSGEIKSCDHLIVEGSVEANLANCHHIEIAESGLYKGSAAIENAEVRGRFEGTLTVKKRLRIETTGKVSGKISYAEIEIAAGGQLGGEVEVLPPEGAGALPR